VTDLQELRSNTIKHILNFFKNVTILNACFMMEEGVTENTYGSVTRLIDFCVNLFSPLCNTLAL